MGVGCANTPEPTTQEVNDEPVVQESVEGASPEAQAEILDDSTVRYYLGSKQQAFTFVIAKGWPVELLTHTTASFKRENEHGFSAMTITVEEPDRSTGQFIQDLFPNVDTEGETYPGLKHGANARYVQMDAGAGSTGVFAQMLDGKLVTVTYGTNSEGVSELGFEKIIASLKVSEVE
ncbi:MAG: hypothetical protein CMI52_01650 [Parcubacteria group bacterium]|nr:hypothetical protein [Parcubacteria group bacterium]